MIVVGSIQTRSWDDTEGKRHSVTEVIADEIYFADSKKSDSGFEAPAPASRLPARLLPATAFSRARMTIRPCLSTFDLTDLDTD